MSLNRYWYPLKNSRGAGLITAIFIIVIVGMFGLLLSRYVVTHSVSSAEDYLWAEALYVAESAINLRLLQEDNTGLTVTSTTIEGFTVVHAPTASPIIAIDRPDGTLNVVASQGGVVREVEVNYTLTIH